MADKVSQAKTVDERLNELERSFRELRSQVLGLKPRDKDWRRTVGTFPRDDITLEAERFGREWRETANVEE